MKLSNHSRHNQTSTVHSRRKKKPVLNLQFKISQRKCQAQKSSLQISTKQKSNINYTLILLENWRVNTFNSFVKDHTILIWKTDTDITRNKSCTPISLMNIKAKILYQIVAESQTIYKKDNQSWPSGVYPKSANSTFENQHMLILR